MRIRHRLIPPALLVAAIVLLPGCGIGSAPSRDAASPVQVRERDFKIRAPRTLPQGRIDLDVDNVGPVNHELIVVRTSGPLRRRTDGLTVDEDALDPETVATLEPGMGERHLTADLRPGRYEMFCNMQGHYLAGMRRSFRVG